jgi:hypothetical protein
LSHGLGSQLSPADTQVPQLGLQHTSPTLQVDLPHIWLTGCWMRLSHGVGSQLWPGATQSPQLGLQQA